MDNSLNYIDLPIISAWIITMLLAAAMILWIGWNTLVSIKKWLVDLFYAIMGGLQTYLFNKVYSYEYASRETIAARKLVKGYFGENSEYPFSFHLIRGVTGTVHKDAFIIRLIVDDAYKFAGQNYFWIDRFQDYVIRSSYFTYKKYPRFHVILKESKYWPTSYEKDEEAFYSGYAELWQEAGDNITFE